MMTMNSQSSQSTEFGFCANHALSNPCRKSSSQKVERVMTASDLLASVELHIQAQEEIKQELLTTIRSLEKELSPPRATLRQVHFHSATLRHVVAEKSAVMDQIAKFKSSTLPDLQHQLDGARQKRATLEAKINALRSYRVDSLMNDLNDPAKVRSSVATFSAQVLAEIQDLTTAESQVKMNTMQAKTELRALQDQFLNRQRENSKQVLAEELIDEKDLLLGKGPKRKRSRTAVKGFAGRSQDRRGSLVTTKSLRF
jgi:hypothetical protein